MAKREIDPKLKKLYDENKQVYSISKINTIDECLYEAYNTYILHEKGINGIYGVLGTKIHEKLQNIIEGTATVAELPKTLNEELDNLDFVGVSFPKDFKGNDSIRNNWIADMKQFCFNFQVPIGKFDTEELFILKLNEDRYVQGYIDLIRYNDDGTISIIDWKTSSEFSKDDLVHHGRQLILYAMAKEQQGYVVRDVSWYMLKYCQISFMGKKRSNSKELSPIVKVINRGKLIAEIKSNLEYDLSAAGYDEVDIECLISKAMEDNSLEALPSEIKDKYKVEPYIRKYEITDTLKQECLTYINTVADKFESLSTDSTDYPPRNFTRVNGKGNEVEDTFFCHTLCNFRNSCKHIKSFDELQKLIKENNEEDSDLF